MPRRARLALPDVPLHITQRGNNRCDCFVDDDDRQLYLDLLREHAGAQEVAVHAYVLMTNHVHLLVTPRSAGAIGFAMRHVNQRYAQYFNRRHGRTGTLWESRPYSCLVEAEAYLLTCFRYIENNPVRAGMVEKPEDYRWSSHRANAFGARDPLLSAHPLITALGRTPQERIREYRELFRTDDRSGAADQLRAMTVGGLALGQESFVKKVATTLGRQTVRGKRGRRWPSR
jgi:putative transposase